MGNADVSNPERLKGIWYLAKKNADVKEISIEIGIWYDSRTIFIIIVDEALPKSSVHPSEIASFPINHGYHSLASR